MCLLYPYLFHFWVPEHLIHLRQPPLPVPEPQPGLSGPFTIPALTFHNYFISLIFPMTDSAPGGPHSSPSSIRQSLTPSALLSPLILSFAGSLRVSLLLSLLRTYKHIYACTHKMGNTIWRKTITSCNFPQLEKNQKQGGKKGLWGRKEDHKTVNKGEGQKKSLNISVEKQWKKCYSYM